jgi:hypothetical protein
MLIVHMFRVWLKLLSGASSAFGIFSKQFLMALIGVPFTLLFTHFMLLLDHIFYPGFKKVKIEKPVFIIGHPRSGTTFIHRLLTETDDYLSFQSWELAIPSLTARKLLRPIIEKRIKAGKHVIFPKEVGHHTRLDTIEEEEQLFQHICDTQFTSIIFPLGFYRGEFEELLWNDKASHRHASMQYFKRCLQRHIYMTGKNQVMAKMNFSSMRVKNILEYFPDARIIYILRDPISTFSSHLSLNTKVFDYKWGLKNLSKGSIEVYYDRRYRYNVQLYKYINGLIQNGELPKDRFTEVLYESLLLDLDDTMVRLRNFMNIPMSDALLKHIEVSCEKQKSFKREHEVSKLDKFGISEEQVRKDLPEIFERCSRQLQQLEAKRATKNA